MKILFLHQNMPGQFKHLAPYLASDPSNQVVFVTKRQDVELKNVRRVVYQPARAAHASTHYYLQPAENAVLHGQQVVRACFDLQQEGFTPDIIVAHPGWGESLFMKDFFPSVPLLSYCEHYARGRGAETGFDPSQPANIDELCRVRTWNAHHLLGLESCDAGWSPTEWQKSLHPAVFHPKISVIFEGINTAEVKPDQAASFTLPDGRILTGESEVVTYVGRNLEPHRGFPSFVRSLPEILRRRPNAQVILVGADEVSYSNAPPAGKTWRQVMLEEVPVDLSRVHFVGRIPYNRYLSLLRVSSVHVYLTVPFVLSWSCVEALAAGCIVVGSKTPPVEEIIEDGRNGFLVDFFSPQQIADRVAHAIENRDKLGLIRRRARETVLQRYDLSLCLPKQLRLVRDLAGAPRQGGGRPEGYPL